MEGFTSDSSGHQMRGAFPKPHEAVLCDAGWVSCRLTLATVQSPEHPVPQVGAHSHKIASSSCFRHQSQVHMSPVHLTTGLLLEVPGTPFSSAINLPEQLTIKGDDKV